MTDELKHECAVALVVLKKDGEHYRNKYGSSDYGGTKLSLLLEKQHNRGQDGAGAAILSSHPESGYMPYWVSRPHDNGHRHQYRILSFEEPDSVLTATERKRRDTIRTAMRALFKKHNRGGIREIPFETNQ